ncbi:MAG: DUF2188 domain-containing protein [Kineosporiaceae bacterium]
MPMIGVSPNGAVWQLTRDGEILSAFDTRDDALAAARDLAEEAPSTVVVTDESAEATVVHETGSREDSRTPREADRGAGHPEPNEAR